MISQKVHYAIAALLYMGKNTQDLAMQVKEIAVQTQVPVKYLELVFSELKKAGLLKSQRGSKGGYRLMQALNTIQLIDLMRILDGELTLSKAENKHFGLDAFFVKKRQAIHDLLAVDLKTLAGYQQNVRAVLSYVI
eukprot:COSAG01_NODE_236_length_20742_cov_2129.910236_11_plen_136_part_00